MTGSRFSFLRRVRIHGGECGAVARALHHKAKIMSLPAALGKVSKATQERKVMSNKTFFKRVAVAAIAALGFGMLSVVPSQATVTAHTLSIDSASDAIKTSETATAVLTHSFVNLGSAQDSVTIRAIVTSSNSSTAGTLTMAVTDSFTSAGNTAATGVSPRYSYGSHGSTGGSTPSDISATIFNPSDTSEVARDSMTISHATADRSVGSVIRLSLIKPTAAGTYTVSVYTQTSDRGAAVVSATPTVTWTITVTAPDRTATAASTSTLRTGEFASGTAAPFSGTAEGTDSSVVLAATDDSDDTEAEATVLVIQKNGTTTNTALESMTVTVSGAAFISVTDTARPTSGKAITVAYDVVGGSEAIYVWSDGNAGTATITVSTVSGLVIDTHTVSFFGDATSVTVADWTKKVLRAGGFANSSAFTIAVKDANGTAVTDASVSFTSSNNAIVTDAACAAYSAAAGGYVCAPSTTTTSTSGQSVTLTARTPDLSTAVTTDFLTVAVGTFTLGGAISTVTLTADKASYAPGEAMILTATALDASGNPTYDGQAGPTWLVSNKSLGGTALGSVMNAYYDGKSTSQTRSALDVRTFRSDNTLFAPNASGQFTIRGVYGTDNSKSVTLTLTVGDDAATAAASAATDAALEAIDAANAATDAANLAAEAADAATVAAEEARDAADAATAAVEALATEVATLMAALKAQITTLANTVAKIAKRVRA